MFAGTSYGDNELWQLDRESGDFRMSLRSLEGDNSKQTLRINLCIGLLITSSLPTFSYA